MGPNLVPKWVPKGDQNGVQNGQKSNAKINVKKEGSQDTRRSVLGPSWGVLGCILGSKIIIFRWFYNGFVKITFLKKIRLERASWTELGSILAPKRVVWGPLGAVWGPLGTVLGPLGTILARCWPVWWPLGRRDCGNVDFSLVLQGFGRPGSVAQPPTSNRAGAAEGVRGRHKSVL